MKTKTNNKIINKSISKLIKERKFDYVNSYITDTLFPDEAARSNEYEVFSFERNISSEDAIEGMAKEGYLAANIRELLMWEGWDGKEWVAALGSVGGVYGRRYVPYLYGRGSRRDLDLGWFDDGWGSSYRFLAVRNPSLGTSGAPSSALGISDAFTLELVNRKLDVLLNHFGLEKYVK